MRNAVLSGTFDPFTNGHLEMLVRAAALFDNVFVAVLNNTSKHPLFDVDERVELIHKVVCARNIKNAHACEFSGILVDFMSKNGIKYIVRGLRSTVDFEYETAMAQVNKQLCDECETIFLASDPKFAHVSSTIVREVGSLGGDISGMVPAEISNIIAERLIKR